MPTSHRSFNLHLRKIVFGLLLPVVYLVGLTGCAARMGSKTIPRDRFDYGMAINRSWKEQMLLNLVKARYADPPIFLEVQQVVTQYTLEGTAALSSSGWHGTDVASAAGVTGRWTESPTITFSPLSGEKFAKRRCNRSSRSSCYRWSRQVGPSTEYLFLP